MITLSNTRTVYDLVQNAGKEYGAKTFIRYEKNYIMYEKTYKELADDSHAIAAWTEEQSKKAGHKIHAAFLGRCSYEYLAALLGVTGSGAVSIPLDIQLNKEAFIDNLNRSDTDILFFDWEFRSQAGFIKEKCPGIKEFICLQKVKQEASVSLILKQYNGTSYVSDAKPEDCGIIIFTSGTTGRGKGVMLSNQNIIDNTFCTTEKKDQSAELYMNVLPIHHIFCINGDVMIIIRYGSSLCLCPDISKMLHYIKLFEPSGIRLVPMMAKMLYNKIAITLKQNKGMTEQEAKELVLGKRLHRIVSGGGYLAPDLAENFAKLGIEIGQGYGMSECSPKISSPDYSRPDKRASVGRIVDGCQVRIVDGEIQVKSPSVMMGYYKDPEQTAESITKDGWLCTGDLGYVDEENFLFLTGRKKNLIILSNGENVSPEGIENLFDNDLLISDVLVYGSGNTIAAEVYPNYEYAQANGIDDIEAEVQKIIASHNSSLPSYSKISNCHIRKHPFEKTSSKKIIRDKYFEAKENEKQAEGNIKKPKNEFQQKLYDLLSDIMGNKLFGIDSNLYNNGLDSLGSILFIEELNKKLGENINLTDLMENNTILKLEQYFENKRNSSKTDLSARDVYPLTNMQKYFVYIIKGNTTSNLPFTFRLGDSVDLDKLKKAIEGTINAHPGLKAIIKFDTDSYKIFRDDTREINIPVINLTEAEWEEKKKEILVPFAYNADDNLFHIYIFQTEKAKYLFFDVAHIMGDGVTMNILLEDVNKLYNGEEIEKETYTFYEYILEEMDREKLGVRGRDTNYIERLLNGIKLRRSILNKKEKCDFTDGTNAVIRQRFERLTRKKILYFCKQNNVSENVVFLTAFNYCISLFSDEPDVFANSIHSGRTDSRWARIAGPLFLTYYYRYTKVPHERVVPLLQKTGKQIMETMKCQISAPRESEMFLQFQGDIINIGEIGGAKTEKIHLQLDSLPFHMQIMNDDKGYFMELRYWENRFDKKQLEIFLICYECVVAAMLEERSVRRLKRHMPEEVYPKHFYIETETLNKEAGTNLVTTDKDNVKVYVLDEGYHKKPYGAWGPLFIMDVQPENITEELQNPYGEGTLYNTGRIARILPDGQVDFVENGGSTVMTDGIHGRRYFNLTETKQKLLGRDDVESAEVYLRYERKINEMKLVAKINGSDKETDIENLE